MEIKKIIKKTVPILDQKCGTSGLRKQVKIVNQPNYLENFVQSVLNCFEQTPKLLVLGGDGRYYNKQAISIILGVCAANDVKEVHLGQNGYFSTPAMSAYIRSQNNCQGAFILTASHNPAGPDNDFGIKFNQSNGGPAQEEFTERVYQQTLNIQEYKTTDYNFDYLDLKLSEISTHKFKINNELFQVKIVDPIQNYVELMKSIFNFDKLKNLIQRKDFKFIFDGMNGISGPYAKQIFLNCLNANENSLINCEPLEDFGGYFYLNKGLHPDPNLVYAEQLVKIMFNGEESPDFGAACDGDADRNMILGKNFFVTPSDLLAVLAANSSCFLSKKLLGVARSMPTSGAIDKVAIKMGLNLYETPTGWKFFGNLMDSDMITICGEESFGTGSNHIREKDGLWAILAMLSILAEKNQNQQKFISVEQILQDHWKQFGRNYYCRYDYEGVSAEGAKNMMEHLKNQFQFFQAIQDGNIGDVYEYIDPVDKSVSKNQGIRFLYKDGSRIIFRLSGTVGATVRIYFEKYESENIQQNNQEALKNLILLALDLSKIKEFTSRDQPTVIT